MIRNARVEKIADGLVSVTAPCVQTGKMYQVTVKESAYKAWQKGALIQTVMPELSADDREFLISGYSPEGWNIAMGPEEEDVEEPDDADFEDTGSGDAANLPTDRGILRDEFHQR